MRSEQEKGLGGAGGQQGGRRLSGEWSLRALEGWEEARGPGSSLGWSRQAGQIGTLQRKSLATRLLIPGRTPPCEGGGRRSCLPAQSPALGVSAPFVIGSGKVRRSIRDNQWQPPGKGVCWEAFLPGARTVVPTSGCLLMGRRASEVDLQNADSSDPRSSTYSGHLTTVGNARAAAKQPLRTLHLQALNPTPEGPAASPWRQAAKCGCARVTERGRGGGGVLVLAARRPFRLVRLKASRSFLPYPFPFPFPAPVLPPSFPSACLPGSGPFSGPDAQKCAAPGPSI